MRHPDLPLDCLEPLPVVYRAVIPPDYKDRMNHMNVRWYMVLYDEAGDGLFTLFGQTPDYYASQGTGGFDLEHHVNYLNEVRIGDTVAIRARLLRRTAKRLHYMLFMVNETRGLLSSTFECVNSHADLRLRRTSPYPDTIAARLDDLIAAHSRLTWVAPVCGAMNA
jgi:acyl-CoA thioester hydrolase